MNNPQLINNEEALRLFFNDELYPITDPISEGEKNIQINAEAPQIKNNPPLEITSENKQVAEKASIPSFEFLGGNSKKILIIINDNIYKVVSPEGKIILSNILNAIKLTKEDYAFLNLSKYPPTSFEQLQAFFECKILLSFGITANELGINSIANHQIGEHNHTKFILSEALHPLSSNTAAKKELWISLKTLFSV